MNTAGLIDLLLEQRHAGFAGISGTRADVTLGIDDGLLNRLIAESIPPDGPVTDIEVHAQPGRQLRVGLRVPRVAFLPRVNLTLAIVGQPRLPEYPLIELRIAGAGGLASMAGPALRFLGALPPGVHISGDLVQLDVHKLMSARGLADLTPYLEHLAIDTDEGRVRLHLRIRVP